QGVLIPGLGTFTMVHEQFNGYEDVYTVRRPYFYLDIDEFFLQELVFPTVIIPGDVKVKLLNYRWLSQATSFSRHLVENCVQETILLYSYHLRSGQHLPFAFKDIGVLSCRDGILGMRFYYECVAGLERKASRVALL
ncbi:Coiled-coil domain-containing protein 81, partial [Buceros rhinoceros silvestris]